MRVRRSRFVRLGAAAALTAVALLGASGPASADVVTPPGACVGSGAWKAGGFSRTTPQLGPDDIIEISRSDEVSWAGTVTGPGAGTSREVAGRVALRLPPLFGTISIADWGGATTDVERKGSYAYDLPGLVPANVELDLLASHDEAGRRHCTATVGLIIAGGAFDSPLVWVALAGLLLFTSLLVLLGRSAMTTPGVGRIAAGALLGLPFGLFVGLTLVLFGLIPLASPLVTTLLGIGLFVGGVWTWWSPLGTKPPVGPV